MREVTRKVYYFNELPEEVQKKVLSDNIDINVDYDWYNDEGLLDYATELVLKDQKRYKALKSIQNLKVLLFKWDNLYFSLDRDRHLQLDKLYINDYEVFMDVVGIPKDMREKVDISFYQEGTRCTDTRLELTESEDFTFTERQQKVVNKAVSIFDHIREQAWKNLNNLYYALIEDKAIEETLIANECEFYEDGQMV